MFRFVSKLPINHNPIESAPCSFRYIQTLPPINSVPSSEEEQQSLTVSYLTNSCGLSLQRANLAAKHVNIVNTEKPDMVLQLLRANGFTQSQISSLISQYPPIILSDPEKTLKPKIEYFESLGVGGPDLCKILSTNSNILVSSLKNRISPTIDFFKEILETNENVINALKRSYYSVFNVSTEVMATNVGTLRAHGVPEQVIRRLLMMESRSLLLRVDLFEEAVLEVKEMGFEPISKSFIYAFRAKSTMSKSNWDRKKKLLMSFGWSEQDFQSAFRVQPLFMMFTSEKKMKELMEFFLTKVRLEPSHIVKYPNLFMLSLEKTYIPRCSVLEVLMSKGLIKKNVYVAVALTTSKKKFEQRFFNPFKKDCPELIKAYQVGTRFEGFSNQMRQVI